MSWPVSQDFNEAVQNPKFSFRDPELNEGLPVLNCMELPVVMSGNFADVYKIHCAGTNTDWAVKCFTRAVPDRQDRYLRISDHVKHSKLPFIIGFDYLSDGIRVHGKWFPILKMRWVEGATLNSFVSDHVREPATLEALFQLWVKLAQWLRIANVAHADLQHGNVLLVSDGKGGLNLNLKLIDYDGMFVPALAGKSSGECGHPNYQHPLRIKHGTYNAEVDRFPHLVIASALRALVVSGGNLWARYDNGDNLLFKQSDFAAPQDSKLFRELWQSHDALTRCLVGQLIRSLSLPVGQEPFLCEVVGVQQPLALSAADQCAIQAILNRPQAPKKIERKGNALDSGQKLGQAEDSVLFGTTLPPRTTLGKARTSQYISNFGTGKMRSAKKGRYVRRILLPILGVMLAVLAIITYVVQDYIRSSLVAKTEVLFLLDAVPDPGPIPETNLAHEAKPNLEPDPTPKLESPLDGELAPSVGPSIIKLKSFRNWSIKAGEKKSFSVEVTRENCNDEIKLKLFNLPDGVRVIGDPVIPAATTQGIIELSANSIAASSGKSTNLLATATGAVRDSSLFFDFELIGPSLTTDPASNLQVGIRSPLAPAKPRGNVSYDQPIPELQLVGFETTYGQVKIGVNAGPATVITSLRPIYATRERELVKGPKLYGKPSGQKRRLLDHPRYAVSAVNIYSGNYIDSIEVDLLLINGGDWRNRKHIKTEKSGGPGGGIRPTLGGDGKQYVGCVVYDDGYAITGLGLIPK